MHKKGGLLETKLGTLIIVLIILLVLGALIYAWSKKSLAALG